MILERNVLNRDGTASNATGQLLITSRLGPEPSHPHTWCLRSATPLGERGGVTKQEH